MQARCLLPKRNEQALEEVFIGRGEHRRAGILVLRNRAGFGAGGFAGAGRAPWRQKKSSTTFTEITRGLVDAWSLGPFIREVVAPGKANSVASSLVRHSVEMARVSEDGWSGREMDQLLEQIGKDIDENPATVRDQLKVNAGEAAKVAVSLGIPQVTELMPGNKASQSSQAQAPAVDSRLQLAILQDLTRSLTEKPDINEVCQLVVEGIHRAIGMQRVALLMGDRTGALLVPRKVGGKGTDIWRDKLEIRRDGTGPLGSPTPLGICHYQPAKQGEGVPTTVG